MNKEKTTKYVAGDYSYSVIKILDPTPQFKINLIEFDESFVLNNLVGIDSVVLNIIQSKLNDLNSKNKRVPIPLKYLKEFTGKMMIRISPTLHQQLYLEAKTLGISLNNLIQKKLELGDTFEIKRRPHENIPRRSDNGCGCLRVYRRGR